jgi:hypothetical protein
MLEILPQDEGGQACLVLARQGNGSSSTTTTTSITLSHHIVTKLLMNLFVNCELFSFLLSLLMALWFLIVNIGLIYRHTFF